MGGRGGGGEYWAEWSGLWWEEPRALEEPVEMPDPALVVRDGSLEEGTSELRPER